jgi:flagellar L-ring protein precursor FlgH
MMRRELTGLCQGLLLCLMAPLAGCISTAPKVDVMTPTQARPAATATTAINSGSLFQAASYRPMFETPRARWIGDFVTVTIVERVSAKQESNSSIEKSGSVSGAISAAPFMKADKLAKLDAKGSSSNEFDGKGSTESSHNFSGTITASVIEVLSNGHLIISGEKQIGLNQNVEVLRFSGQVDPLTLQPGNVVASDVVANVRIEQRGRGAQDAAQGIGWLGRFFLSVSPL